MARTWLQVRVDLVSGGGADLDPTPGRIFIVGPSHTFRQLATAIDTAFARWDIAHEHVFELSGGRCVGNPDDAFGSGARWLDDARVKVAAEVGGGEEFWYVFDLGDEWRHRCTVSDERFDPTEDGGPPPKQPVPIEGWGAIPDQYGRESFEDDGE